MLSYNNNNNCILLLGFFFVCFPWPKQPLNLQSHVTFLMGAIPCYYTEMRKGN